MAIEIKFLSNIVGLLRGTKDVGAALEKVSGSLDDVAAEARHAGDELGDALGDGAKEAGRRIGSEITDGAKKAETAVERIERSFDLLLEQSRRTTRKVGDDLGDDIRKGAKRAEKGVEELKDESQQSAREMAASFKEPADALDAVQEIAANALSGFGPAGMLAGAAAAVGIGLAASGFEQVKEAEQASKERAAEWADAYVEAGGRILSATQVVEKARAIITDPDRYKEAQDNAREWGVNESVAILAMSGDMNALTEATEALRRKKREVAETPIEDMGSSEFQQLRQDWENGTEALNKLNEEQRLGAVQADTYSESLRLLAEHTAGATQEVDQFGDTVVTLPDGKQIYIDAETRQATDSVDQIEKRVYGIQDKTFTVRGIADMSGIESAIRGLDGRSISVRVQGQTGPGRHVY